VALGVLLGLAVAFAATRVLATMLFGVAASDAATYVGTALLWRALPCSRRGPARKATRVDPMVALRAE
jgi:hypothetical protein